MFSLCVYDYETKEKIMLSSGTFINMWMLCESAMLNYILCKQGDMYGDEYPNFLYKFGISPDRSRGMKGSPFYIEIDKYDNYKYIVVKKQKNYYWFGRSDFTFINHKQFMIIKDGEFLRNPFYNNFFEEHYKYDDMLVELEQHLKEYY